jgi:hypothetical protein
MRLLGLAAAAVAVVSLSIAAGAGAFGGDSYPPQGAPPPPSAAELRTLAALTVRDAALAGEAHPTDAVVVPTTRRIAEEVDAGDNGEANTPAYFILMHGRFTSDRAPPSGPSPTGTVATLTVDARTNNPTDGGIETRVPDLFAIGIPEPLPLVGQK